MSRKAKDSKKVNITPSVAPVDLQDCEEISLDSLNTIDDGNDELERHIAADDLGEELDCGENEPVDD